MSLRVWLPLDGTLENKGLSDINLNFSPTYITGGKIGNKCLASQLGWFEIPDMAGKKQMSFAYWVKINTATSTNWLDTFSWYSTNGSNNYRNRQEFYTNSTRTNVWYKASSANSTNSSFVNTIGKWNHYVFTIDYDRGEACFYINGEITGTKRANIDTTSYIKGTGSAFLLRENGLDSHINDFRLYDHILSPLEVKQISQGLILHYPLNRNGWGQENLSDFSSIINNWIMERLTGSNYQDDNYGNVIKLVSSSTNKRMYHNVTNVWENGQIYTVSFLAKADTNDVTCDMSRSIADFTSSFSLTTKWEKYQGIITSTATVSGGTLSFRIHQSGKVVYITKIKLEKGSKATPWCPNSSDILATTMGLNDNIEYDTSGYGNNGVKVGTFDYNSDTPKYDVSSVFLASPSVIKIPNSCYAIQGS